MPASGERPCPSCGALVIYVAPWGVRDVAGQGGSHQCEQPRVEIPLQRECARCFGLIETYQDGRRLGANGEPHECREQATPALAPVVDTAAGHDSIPAAARRGEPSQPVRADAPRPPATPARKPRTWLGLDA